MSQDRSESTSQLDDDDEDDGSGVESWLRRVAHAPSDRIPLPQIGQIIAGKYRIEQLLGRAAWARCSRATHVVSGKRVALKWMLPDLPPRWTRVRALHPRGAARRAASTPERRRRLRRRPGRRLGLPGDGAARGESLRQRLERARARAERDACASLLPGAARRGARRTPPASSTATSSPTTSSCARAPDGAAREPKVLDFGISKIVELGDGRSTPALTKTGTVMGTPYYMSPEQVRGMRDVDARTDVYAFGVILYEVLTGRVPFAGETYSALVLAIANSKARPPRELRSEIPIELERVVMRAMDKDRNTRLQSMDALIAALLPFASVRSSGSGELASVELRRSTRPGAAPRRTGAVVAMLLLAAAGLAWWWMHGEAKVADAPHAQAASVAPGPTPAAAAPAVVRTSLPWRPSRLSSARQRPPSRRSSLRAPQRRRGPRRGLRCASARVPAARPQPDPRPTSRPRRRTPPRRPPVLVQAASSSTTSERLGGPRRETTKESVFPSSRLPVASS